MYGNSSNCLIFSILVQCPSFLASYTKTTLPLNPVKIYSFLYFMAHKNVARSEYNGTLTFVFRIDSEHCDEDLDQSADPVIFERNMQSATSQLKPHTITKSSSVKHRRDLFIFK